MEDRGYLPLDELEVRVLGTLLEKQMATPDYYPMSLNALTQAVNQKSNRNPVLTCTTEQVNDTIRLLQEKRLAYGLDGAGMRTLKYGHRLEEEWHLDRAALAVLCELMVRGPQTAGELRSRTKRLGIELAETTADALLKKLSSGNTAWVVQLERLHGQREERYAHLLSGQPDTSSTPEDGPQDIPIQKTTTERITELESRLEQLEQTLGQLREEFARFRSEFE